MTKSLKQQLEEKTQALNHANRRIGGLTKANSDLRQKEAAAKDKYARQVTYVEELRVSIREMEYALTGYQKTLAEKSNHLKRAVEVKNDLETKLKKSRAVFWALVTVLLSVVLAIILVLYVVAQHA